MKIKVLFISTGDSKYGAPKSLQSLMKILRDEYGVECVLLTKRKNNLNVWCDENHIENYSMFYRDIMAGDNYEKWYLNFAKHFLKRVLFCIGGITQHFVHNRIPDLDSFDIIHTNTNRVDIGAFISEHYHIPHIWHLRELDEGVKNMHYYRKKWSSYMNDHADAFVAITQAVYDSWVNHGLLPGKVHVIYNGIDPQTIIFKDSLLFDSDNLKIVSVGRIERGKGQEDLVRAICSLPDNIQEHVSIDFIGEAYADYKKHLENIICTMHGSAKFNFCGYKSNVGELLQNYDIGITASPAEAFGRTTVEYMLAGLLVIATNTGANPELIQNNKNGLLYEVGNSDMLAKHIENVFKKEINIESLANKGHEDALSEFSAAQNAENVYKLYSNVLKINYVK